MCADVNTENLVTVHHEMGVTEYQMAYRHQPMVFRDGANPGAEILTHETITLHPTLAEFK